MPPVLLVLGYCRSTGCGNNPWELEESVNGTRMQRRTAVRPMLHATRDTLHSY